VHIPAASGLADAPMSENGSHSMWPVRNLNAAWEKSLEARRPQASAGATVTL